MAQIKLLSLCTPCLSTGALAVSHVVAVADPCLFWGYGQCRGAVYSSNGVFLLVVEVGDVTDKAVWGLRLLGYKKTPSEDGVPEVIQHPQYITLALGLFITTPYLTSTTSSHSHSSSNQLKSPVPQPQSTFPGGSGLPSAESHDAPGMTGQTGSPPPSSQPDFNQSTAPLYTPPVYIHHQGRADAASYYNNNNSHAGQHPQAASLGAYPTGGQAQYDMDGRPIGLGKDYRAMAMGTLTGLAKKKMMGGGHGHHSGKHSSGSHALMAEGAKMLHGMYKDNSNKAHDQGPPGYGSSHGYQQQPQYGGHGSPPAQHGGGQYGSSPGAGTMGAFGKREA